MAIKQKFLIDLSDHSNWLYTASPPSPREDSKSIEDMAVLIMPDDSGRKLYTMTDSLMYPTEKDEYMLPLHEHRKGYETFFVDSGDMDLWVNGKIARVVPGSLLHLQPYEIHRMVIRETVKFRGFFQDWNGVDIVPTVQLLEHNYPGISGRFFEANAVKDRDFFMHESADYTRVEAEEVAAIRHPYRPLARFDLDGISMKMMIGRWETAGVREVWRMEMEEGFHAEWVDFPEYRELYYVTGGEIRFKVCEDEFVAHSECLVDIPKHLPHSIEVQKNAVVYDMGGMTCWFDLLHDYTTLLKKAPGRIANHEEMAELLEFNRCQIKSYGW